jgi:hypothetical protein
MDGLSYLEGDVAYFVSWPHYLWLTRRTSSLPFLRKQADIGEECLSSLRSYPGLRIEPLEFFYTCLRNLGALDAGFFHALIHEHNWRGAVWGAWLAILQPGQGLADDLRTLGEMHPENRWFVDCAIAACEQTPASRASEDFMAVATRFRRCLEGVERPRTPLRVAPNREQAEQMGHEFRQIRAAYVAQGADAALQAMRGTLVAYYAQSYPRWLRAGAPPPPSPADRWTSR